jgi:DNA-directed RNA polymerase beta' subunit
MDETTVTPEAETIAPAEGSINAIEAEIVPEAPAPKKDETVPLSVYLSLKDEAKELKRDLKEATRPQTKKEEKATIKAFTEKYPDTDPDAIASIIEIAVAEVEAKYSPIIESQTNERKQKDFDTKFDAIYEQALASNPDAKGVDKEIIKTLALTPQYNNTPLVDLIQKIYPSGNTGKATTENDMRISADTVERNVDIDKITPEQRSQILANPDTRKAYFDKLDALGR